MSHNSEIQHIVCCVDVNVSESSSISASQASQLDLRVDEEADMLLSRLNSEPMLPDQISPKHPEVGEALRRRDRIELKKAIKAEHEKQRKVRWNYIL